MVGGGGYQTRVYLTAVFSARTLFAPIGALFLLRFVVRARSVSFLGFIFAFTSFIFRLPDKCFSSGIKGGVYLMYSEFLVVVSLLTCYVFPCF